MSCLEGLAEGLRFTVCLTARQADCDARESVCVGGEAYALKSPPTLASRLSRAHSQRLGLTALWLGQPCGHKGSAPNQCHSQS